MSIMNLLDPSAKCLGRTSTAEYHGSQKLVFGASLLVWVVWFAVTFYIWFAAGQANLLASLEFGWSFGTTFSILSTSLHWLGCQTPLTLPLSSAHHPDWINRADVSGKARREWIVG